MARAKKRSALTSFQLSRVPALVGGALLEFTGRGLKWSLTRVWRKPGGTAVTLVMTIGTGLAAANAMYMQTSRHPAPMLIDHSAVTASVTPADPPHREPLVTRKIEVAALPKKTVLPPIEKPKSVPEPVVETTPAPVSVPEPLDGEIGTGPITHKDVLMMQQKLKDLGYFSGDVDGFYGPQTADAIREFEKAYGLEAVGALTRETLARVAATEGKPKPVAEPVPTPEPTPLPLEVVETPVEDAAAIEQPVVDLAPAESPSQNLPKRLQGDPLTLIANKVATTARKAILESRPKENQELVENVQRGLASLGFLQGRIDGVAGEATAKAIRNFEVYYNYDVTGSVTPELLDLLKKAGAE